MENKDFIDLVKDVLVNNVGDSLTQIKKNIREKIEEEKIKVKLKNKFDDNKTYEGKIKELFDEFNSAILKYSKNNKEINKISPILSDIID